MDTPSKASPSSLDVSPQEAAENVAHNIRQIRETRGLSQAQLAKMADIPRPTWTLLERGDGNPTLSNLLRVASVLQITLDELVAPPRASAQHFARTELRSRTRTGVTVEDLLPTPLPSLQIERMTLPPGSAMTGVPHTAGTREILTCEQGKLQLSASGETWTLEVGDVVAFRGDQKHAYKNVGRSTVIAFSVVSLAPL